jgi:hypothetical protein
VIHGNGDTIDGFADIVIVNYEVLDRHGVARRLPRGMVVDEAHHQNKTSQRSQTCSSFQRFEPASRVRLMALTGTPINDIRLQGHLAVSRWIDDKPLAELMNALEETGDAGRLRVLPAARKAWSTSAVRRARSTWQRHPRVHRRPSRRARREGGRSIREAERDSHVDWCRGTRAPWQAHVGPVVRGSTTTSCRVATWERVDTTMSSTDGTSSL